MQPAQSFAELLDPIPHAAETLAAIDENSAEAPEPAIRLAQADHHHHHHHYRRYHHHHHHHHHHYHHHHRVIIEKHY
jgi:ribulose kinase